MYDVCVIHYAIKLRADLNESVAIKIHRERLFEHRELLSFMN